MTSAPSDGWNAGSTYEEFTGRWSRPVAEQFVGWLDAELRRRLPNQDDGQIDLRASAWAVNKGDTNLISRESEGNGDG